MKEKALCDAPVPQSRVSKSPKSKRTNRKADFGKLATRRNNSNSGLLVLNKV